MLSMSEDMAKEDWVKAVAKFFPKCPLREGKSLEFDIEFGREYDYVNCHNCYARWEIDWKGDGYIIESIKLVEVIDVEKYVLQGKRYDPKFWLKMALRQREVQPVVKEKEIIKEKEVIVKIRCQYCHHVYDETLDRCPHCGGRR